MSAPDVQTPAQLADLRLWLADQWKPGRPFHDLAAAMHSARSITASNPVAYANHERGLLEHATLWWVAEDMVDLLLASAANVPDDVHVADLPKMPGAGLVVFAKPWWGVDADQPDRQVQVDALLWGAARLPAIPSRGRPDAGMALSTCTYRRLDFDMGLASDELGLAAATGAIWHGRVEPIDTAPVQLQEAAKTMLEARPGEGTMGSVGSHPDDSAHGTIVHDEGNMQGRLRGETWCPLGRSDWPVDDPIGSPPWDMPEATTASMVEDRKVLAAFWTLMHQEGIASRIVHKAERGAARRTQRAGLDRATADVQVVTLRKLERTEHPPDDEDHPGVEWTHRWLVAGHWRWQPYGPQRSLRRLTYVRPHVKGPEHLPLHVPTRVNAWVR